MYIKIRRDLIFLIGLFSTFQIIQIFNITIFSLLLFIFIMFEIVYNHNFKINKKNEYMYIYFLLATISETMCLSINLKNKNQWIISSLRKYLLLAILILFGLYLINNNTYKIKIFLRGVYYSCFIEMLWCYLQFIILHISHIDINEVIWKAGQLNLQGQNVLTGLNVNAGILSPAIIFLYLATNKVWIKLFSMVLFFISGTSTMMISGTVLLLGTIVQIIYKNCKLIKITRNKFMKIMESGFLIVVILILIGAFLPGLYKRVTASFIKLISRIISAKNGNFSDGSTFTHFRYYTSILYIWQNINIYNIFFGYGIGCSGVPFVSVFNQYSDSVYVPESDIIGYLYDFGLFGFLIIYTTFILIILKAIKIDKKCALFMISVIVGGVFYGMQLNWVLLIEWLFYDYMRKKISIFSLIKEIPLLCNKDIKI